MKELGERLKALRKSKGLSQSELAQELGVSVRSYHRYERGEINAPITALVAAADYFGVSADYLLGRTDKPVVNREECRPQRAEPLVFKADVEAVERELPAVIALIQALKAAGFTFKPNGE